MRDNITKVAERGENLNSLQDKTGEYPLLDLSALETGTHVVRIYGGFSLCLFLAEKEAVSCAFGF